MYLYGIYTNEVGYHSCIFPALQYEFDWSLFNAAWLLNNYPKSHAHTADW